MNFLDQVTHGQRELIISLPYRVGYYISQSDTTGGDEAESREMQALANIIHGFADSMLGSESIQYVMTETIAHQDKWPEWSKKLRTVPNDCRTALDVISVHLNEKDVTAFQNHLMEIGEAVAMAFQEVEAPRDEAQPWKQIEAKIKEFLDSLKPQTLRPPRHEMEAYLSISPAEREALRKIAAALRVKY